MKKVLIITTISGFVPTFEIDNVRILKELGYEVHYASNFKTPVYEFDEDLFEKEEIIIHHIDFVRSPFDLKNIHVYKQLHDLLKNNKFEAVHVHTPMGSVHGRIVAKCNKVKNVIYTAHGFHFYQGAPFLNWCIYYPMEYLLSYITDTLITINEEDFNLSKKRLKATNNTKIPGPGINVQEFSKNGLPNTNLRSSFQIPAEAFVLVTVGELNKNKNQKTIISALAQCENENIYYLLCGKGDEEEELKRLVEEYKLGQRVRFLGYRQDVKEILSISNCYIMASIREGLGVAAIEAMAMGLPIITSNGRGPREYNDDGVTGYMLDHYDIHGYKRAIETLCSNPVLLNSMSNACISKSKLFEKSITNNIMKHIYENMV